MYYVQNIFWRKEESGKNSIWFFLSSIKGSQLISQYAFVSKVEGNKHFPLCAKFTYRKKENKN